jgi:hypothetical protein
MANNEPEDKLREEADEYVKSLPDETAEGRLVNDDGSPADTAKWQTEEDRQQALLKGKQPPE